MEVHGREEEEVRVHAHSVGDRKEMDTPVHRKEEVHHKDCTRNEAEDKEHHDADMGLQDLNAAGEEGKDHDEVEVEGARVHVDHSKTMVEGICSDCDFGCDRGHHD